MKKSIFSKNKKNKRGQGRQGSAKRGIFFAVLIFALGAGLFSTESAARGNANDARNGVVSVQFYLKGAAYYAVNVNNSQDVRKVQDFGTNGEGGYSSGSGFFVGKSGEDPIYIVTNHHVVDSYIDANEGGNFSQSLGMINDDYLGLLIAESCELRIYYEENDYDVAYVDCYGDREKVDLAVLKIRNATDKRCALQIEVPTADMVGETIYTIGFPGNAENMFTGASKYGLEDVTMRKGSITRFAANEGKGVERIQVDAVIQHGNSGGPLVTEDGYVIGVNTNVISTSPYANQIEADYYAINASELVTFLDRNNIPYEMAGQGGGFSVWIIVICGVVCAAAVAAAVVVSLRKKKSAAVPKAGKGSAGNGSSAPVRRALIRSMAVQHNGLTLAVGEAPLLIGRDPANCKLVYVDGTKGVSGRHCSISYDATTGEFILTDLRSTYGTFLMGGQKLNANVPYRLKPGESFYLGEKANAIRMELG